MKLIFADSSILIAGSASSTGASRVVLTMAEIGLFKLLVSEQVLEECQRNINKKLPKAMPVFNEIIDNTNLEVLPNPSLEKFSAYVDIIEPKDAPILAAALLVKADRLLSLNTKDFTQEVAQKTGIIIQTPSEFIQDIRSIITQEL
ncbi:putative toxin-antitoxin system toxin component, PIN family [Cyanothece sp. BG0011]|uniref:PIN domain-containing protein n=1 Tax=Cyanothece sp. BG0011 TaxID=2082950 RepID=UPI000D1D5AC7|nr:PIN domain-containing protein [Cyanothece sp. BG0011]